MRHTVNHKGGGEVYSKSQRYHGGEVYSKSQRYHGGEVYSKSHRYHGVRYTVNHKGIMG